MINLIFCVALFAMWQGLDIAGAGLVLTTWLWFLTALWAIVAVGDTLHPIADEVHLSASRQMRVMAWGFVVFVAFAWIGETMLAVSHLGVCIAYAALARTKR